jgi:hypothetical protein
MRHTGRNNAHSRMPRRPPQKREITGADRVCHDLNGASHQPQPAGPGGCDPLRQVRKPLAAGHRKHARRSAATGVGDDGEVIDVPSPSKHLGEHELSTSDHLRPCQQQPAQRCRNHNLICICQDTQPGSEVHTIFSWAPWPR